MCLRFSEGFTTIAPNPGPSSGGGGTGGRKSINQLPPQQPYMEGTVMTLPEAVNLEERG